MRAAAGGRGVDVAVEVGGPGTFDQSVKALRYGGTMSILGILTGTRGPVDTRSIFYKNIRVHGVYVGSVAMFEDLVRALEARGSSRSSIGLSRSPRRAPPTSTWPVGSTSARW